MKDLIHSKHRWFIWTIIIIVVVGVSLTTYAYITGVNIEAETSEVVFAFHASRKGKIKIVSNPKGAKIYLDSKDTEEETDATISTKPGAHILKLTKDGYKDYIVEIEVERGEEVQISVGLEEGEGITYVQEVSETDDWETYENKDYGFKIKYPPTYTIQSEVKDKKCSIDFYPEDEELIWNCRLSIFPNEKTLSLKDYLTDLYGFSDLKFNELKTNDGMTALKPAKEQTSKYYEEFGSLGSGLEYNYWFIGNEKWIFSLFHNQAASISDVLAEKMLSTFQFTE